MTTSHLPPELLERLIDGLSHEDAPDAWTHVTSCATCRQDLEAGLALVATLEAMPDVGPSAGFADRVMQDVQVFEPWHVALRDAVRTVVTAWFPSAPLARAGALVMTLVAAGLSGWGAWWALGRADIAVFLAQAGLEQVRSQLTTSVTDLVHSVLGDAGRDVLTHGSAGGLALVVLGFVGVVSAVVLGLRAVAIDPVVDE